MRKAVVAGRFYPGDADELKSTVQTLTTPSSAPEKATAVISPHAGYIYSGELAGKTLRSVTIPDTVLLLGPNHTGEGHSAALSTNDWQIPTGTLPNNSALSEILLKNSQFIIEDEVAHQHEHSLEVQLPFLKHLNPNVSIVPITISAIPFEVCQALATELSDSIKQFGQEVLILASNDMSHFRTREVGSQLDKMALDHVLNFEPQKLYQTVRSNNISMCGVIPVTITLLTASLLGAKKCELTGYCDSGDVSGDTNSVVGYAGVKIQ